MSNEVIVVKQIPVIEERLQQIKTEVAAKVERAINLVCTEDTVKEVKTVRAELNKELKEWEEKRKVVKSAIMSPYEQFESVYKDCVSDAYKAADMELKKKIDGVESELKEQKRKEVFYYFEELCEANGLDFLTFERANINVTLSASLKSLKEQAKALVDRVCDDLTLIDSQEHKEEILYEYKQSLNVSAAITTVVNRYKAIEEAKAREAERQARTEAEQKAAEKVETVVETLTPPTVEEPAEAEPKLTVKFTVKGTRTQLKALKEFLNNGGYDYE